MEGPLTSAGLIASLILAAATYELIEKGFRKLKIETAFRPLIIGRASTAGVAAIFVFSGGINYRYRKAIIIPVGSWTSVDLKNLGRNA